MENANCHCGNNKPFNTCCEPFLLGSTLPPTAEALMRSRYSAFAVANVDYLQKTLVRASRRTFDRKGSLQWAKMSTWKGLEIVAVERGQASDTDGIVEFIARYEVKGEPKEHHERSLFRKNGDQWLYVTGDML